MLKKPDKEYSKLKDHNSHSGSNFHITFQFPNLNAFTVALQCGRNMKYTDYTEFFLAQANKFLEK